MDKPDVEETFVAISGAGPTGALLSALLGSMGVPNVVLEREADITTDPRGIALDEDGIRILQAIGMYERVFTEIGFCQKMQFITGTGNDFTKTPLLTADYTTSEGGTGHVGFIFHKQPVLERAIRDAIKIHPSSDLRCNSTVTGVRDDGEHVEIDYEDSEGSPRVLRAKFLVAADGKTGYVRKKFLEPKGVLMERCQGTDYDETWVAVNWHIHLPTPKTHPDFPLWKFGYSGEQIYDLFFPTEFRFLCNPVRPSVCGRFGLPKQRLWRFEFVINAGENAENMSTQPEVNKIIFPYLVHPGSRYNLQESVQFPPDCIETLRSRPFGFSARSCNRWSENRVIVAGDAAHVFPPFGGQGIASGFRDSLGLAWRLAHLHREPTVKYSPVLEAWYLERKQQLERSLAQTIQNGQYVNEGDFLKCLLRDWSLWAVQFVPSWRREIQKGQRADGMTRYTYAPGMPFIPELGGGINLPQVYCVDLATNALGFTDDIVFAPAKRALFQLLILARGSNTASSALSDIRGVGKLSRGWIDETEVTTLIHDLSAKTTKNHSGVFGHPGRVARIASAAEFAADVVLCKNRPEPAYYDPFRIQREVGGRAKFVIVRPDKFVYAACSTREELDMAMKRLPVSLGVPE
ncbi:hypothetical protein LTS10_001893 [Elasticomyces elasticus]|nr:hypothetical protein LTS10_001893 [Elasticomyces elasticus]